MRAWLAFFAVLLPTLLYAQDDKIIADWPASTARTPQRYIPLYEPKAGQPLPQDALLEPNLTSIMEAREDMQLALVVTDLGLGNENPLWEMSQTALTVFLNKLATWSEDPVYNDGIWPFVPARDPRYQGIIVLLQTKQGRRFAPIRVFEGKLVASNAAQVARDPGRNLEYWLFGTARVRRDQLLGSQLLPVYTFDQCRTLGQRVIETTPRQCLLADNNLMLETVEPPTILSAQLTTFAQCLQQGQGLIYTFPRRCITAGGRVFTEPPVVIETPPEKPLLSTVLAANGSATSPSS
jgi:hypothetical protein